MKKTITTIAILSIVLVGGLVYFSQSEVQAQAGATNQDIKDFFALTGTNPAVTNAQLADVSAWLTQHRGLESPATAGDLVDYVYQTLREQVISHKRNTATVTF